jgi:TPP-dependent pyruvate/acetoin dehydrogenase alpha subunit
VYVCENNQYAMSARSDWSVAGGNPAARAAGYGIPGVTVDGMDLVGVNAAACEFVERARRGDGPAYLVCDTYRFHGHHAGDPLNYREKEEVERWRLQDPIERVKAAAVEGGAMRPDEIVALEKQIETQIEEAVEFAKNSPDPTPDQLMTDIYA